MDTFKCFVVPCDQTVDLLQSRYSNSVIILMETTNFHKIILQNKIEIYFGKDNFCKK